MSVVGTLKLNVIIPTYLLSTEINHRHDFSHINKSARSLLFTFMDEQILYIIIYYMYIMQSIKGVVALLVSIQLTLIRLCMYLFRPQIYKASVLELYTVGSGIRARLGRRIHNVVVNQYAVFNSTLHFTHQKRFFKNLILTHLHEKKIHN